ncbi:MAG: hypothetical protein HRU23_18995 [Gammaproteobacteria bacterium]|nr:hypothetical protein [Gammaproteobacteria bacterium]
MLNYPDSLPSPLLKPLSFKRQSNVLRTKMDSGQARVRRRFKSVPTSMTATWRCKSTDAAVFEGFITHALHDGSAWFTMNILTPLGLVQHEVRFITSPMENYQPISAIWWQYKAQIEIKHRLVISEQKTADSILSPNTAQQFSDGIKAAIESYQE